MASTSRLMVVDGSNVFYRSYFAMNRTGLCDQRGRPTGGLFMATKQFLSYLRLLEPSHCIWLFDHGRSEMRTALREDYKGHRKTSAVADSSEQPERSTRELIMEQVEAFRELLTLCGVAHLSQRGVEADDLIATVIKGKDWPYQVEDTVIVSGDHDMFQLISDSPLVRMFRPGDEASYTPRPGVGMGNLAPTSTLFGVPEVVAKYGLPPSKLAEMYALVGDNSDNIKGIYGVGIKTATKWIQKYGDLSRVLAYEQKCAGWEKHCAINLELMQLDGSVGEVPMRLSDCELAEDMRQAHIPLAAQPFIDSYDMTSLIKENA